MVERTKRISCGEACLAISLGVTAVLLLGGASSARASGGKGRESGTESAAPVLSSVRKQRRRLRAEERDMANAVTGRRDPFRLPPPPRPGGGDPLDGPLPPGTRGLVIGWIKLKGIVREDASGTMIAVVTNPSNIAYFLHVHDRVYNGVVTGITANSIHFAEDSLDSSGQLEKRELVLKLGSDRQEAR